MRDLTRLVVGPAVTFLLAVFLDFTLATDGIALRTPRIVAIDLRFEVAVVVAVLAGPLRAAAGGG